MDKREFAKLQRNEIKSVLKRLRRRPENFGYHGDLDMFNTWALGPAIEHRDSNLIERANCQAIIQKFEELDPDCKTWQVTCCNHWAVGWVNHLSFKLTKQVLHTEVPTKALELWLEIEQALSAYPLLNEELYSQLEYDATLDNIEWAAGYYARKHGIDLPDDYASTLFGWFWDNLQSAVESSDDTGGYPSDDELEKAFIGLGWL